MRHQVECILLSVGYGINLIWVVGWSCVLAWDESFDLSS